MVYTAPVKGGGGDLLLRDHLLQMEEPAALVGLRLSHLCPPVSSRQTSSNGGARADA